MLLTTMFVWKVAALMLWPVVAVVWGLSIVTVLDMVYHRTLLKSERF
jgi:sterol desaturase/sphingolipid hydroxylase (fatty acid hydroxylase superfamily)